MVNITTPSSEDLFWRLSLEKVLSRIYHALSENNSCRIGLTGGSTPKKLYELLAGERLPWEKVRLIIVDERYVPRSSRESNYKMINKALFKRIKIPRENIIAFDTSLGPDECVQEMEMKLQGLLRERGPLFDLLILGAGPDGHIASLFKKEQTPDLSRLASLSTARGYKTEKRITCTLTALLKSEQGILLLSGREKEPVVTFLTGETVLQAEALKELVGTVPVDVLYFSGKE
jgi:6-phosphogluconolactonase